VGVSSSVLASVQGVTELRLVPPGVDVAPVETEAARRELRVAIAAGSDDVILAAIGRLDVAKGFDTAIDALADVRRHIPSARLVIIGGEDPRQPGTGAALLERAAAVGVRDQVHLLGHRHDAQRLIAGADVVLVTSRAVDARGMGREGFGLVAAEALALGVPVVGFRDGAVPEVVGNAGVLVDPGDLAGLADGVRRVVESPGLRDELVSNGRRQAARFATEDWLRAMVAAYSDVAAASGAR
jgi:glycosyltransferase involved in cell wall biosynthesis